MHVEGGRGKAVHGGGLWRSTTKCGRLGATEMMDGSTRRLGGAGYGMLLTVQPACDEPAKAG